jgi:hypothetical protein
MFPIVRHDLILNPVGDGALLEPGARGVEILVAQGFELADELPAHAAKVGQDPVERPVSILGLPLLVLSLDLGVCV